MDLGNGSLVAIALSASLFLSSAVKLEWFNKAQGIFVKKKIETAKTHSKFTAKLQIYF